MNKKEKIKADFSKRESKAWKVVAYALIAIQAVASVAAIITLIMLDMLPGNFLGAIVIIFLMLLLLAFLMLVVSSKQRKKKKKSLIVKRGIGLGISCFTTIICIIIVMILSKLISTVSGITEPGVVVETTAVYVMADNSAQNLDDAKNYTFGYTTVYDYENTQKAFENIKNETDVDVVKQEYASVDELVAGLYSGEAGAIVLNEAYEQVLQDTKEYSNFATDTRKIYESKVETVIEQKEPRVENITEESFVIYISGSDTRSTTLTKSRSDVNILGIVNPQTKQVLLVNTPRDYYVQTSVSGGARDKLTHCGLYGIDCSMATLGMLYGCDVDYYGHINFSGFETLVNAVGGINVDVDKAFTSSTKSSAVGTTYSYTKGENYMDGAKALVFVRERQAFADGDFARGRHQMAAIKGLIKKMTSGAILTHYSDIMDSLEGMCSTDFSSSEISDLVKMQLAEGGEWNIKSFSVTGNVGKEQTYTEPGKKRSIVYEDPEKIAKAKELIQKVMNGGTITDADLE